MEHLRQIEEELNKVIGKEFKEIFGRGPRRIKTIICRDMVIIRLKPYPEPICKILKVQTNNTEILNDLRKVTFETVVGKLKELLSKMIKYELKEIHFDYAIDHDEASVLAIYHQNVERGIQPEEKKVATY